MNIPAPFTAVDVNFTNTTEMALLLNSVAGYAVLTYGATFPGPGNATNPVPTGLVGANTYTATVTVDATGGNYVQLLSFLGSTALTFPTLISQINAGLGGFATAALVGSDIVITSATSGVDSSVTVLDTGAFPLFGSVGGTNSVNGNYFGLVKNVPTKGGTEYVAWPTLDFVTQTNIASAVNGFLAAATANTNVSWASGFNAVSLSPVGPATSVLQATDTTLSLNPTPLYDLNINVDGAGAVNVTIPLPLLEVTNMPVTFSHLAIALNYALASAGVKATATFTPGATGTITVTSNSVGTSSTVVVAAGTNNDLLAALAAFVPTPAATAGVNGATNVSFPVVKTRPAGNEYSIAVSTTFNNWNDVMQMWPSPTGFGALFTAAGSANVFKGKKPASKGHATRTAVFFDGTNWVYFDNGVTTGAAVPPPELSEFLI